MQFEGVDHRDFPHSTAWAEGVEMMEADLGARNVYVHLNVGYATKSGRQLHLQVIQPCLDSTIVSWDELTAERFGCIAFVQGSAWGEQPMGALLEFWCRFARRGYVVALIEYRPSDLAAFPAQVQDVKTAVRWLTANHARFGIDPEQMVLAGDSSGGHTALLVHATQALDDLDDEPGVPLDLKACVDFYGPTRLDLMNDEPTTMDHRGPDSPEGRLLGGVDLRSVPELVRRADPGHWVSADRPLTPLLMIHGSKDRLVPFAQSVEHYRVLRAAGQPVRLIQVRGAGHGGPALFTAQVADAVDLFLQDALGPRPATTADGRPV